MNNTELASSQAAKIRAALKSHAVALAANSRDSKRLAALADEIATLDARLDAEDLNQVQRLSALREQQARLATKYEADAERRLIESQTSLDAALDREKLSALFKAERASLLAEICAALAPFESDTDLIRRVTADFESFRRVDRLGFALHNVNPPPLAEIASALEAIATGKTPWRLR